MKKQTYVLVALTETGERYGPDLSKATDQEILLGGINGRWSIGLSITRKKVKQWRCCKKRSTKQLNSKYNFCAFHFNEFFIGAEDPEKGEVIWRAMAL
jgi:hypothetical protein